MGTLRHHRSTSKQCSSHRLSQATRQVLVEPLEGRVLLSGGTLDPTFGTAGLALINEGNTNVGRTEFADLAVQGDGKIIAVGQYVPTGQTDNELLIARFNTNGSLDTTFGTGGTVTQSLGSGTDDYASGVTLLGNGQFLVTARTGYFSSNAGSGYVLRYNANGALDPTFATNGQYSDALENIESLTVEPNGTILAPGTIVTNGANEFAVLRLTANGALDTTFGTGGRVAVNFTVASDAGAAAVQPDGKIVVVGTAGEDAANADIAVVRLNPDGSLDSTFATAGQETIDGSNRDASGGVIIQPDGKIVISDLCNRWADNADDMLLRLNTNGSLDKTFGNGGRSLLGALIVPPADAGSSGFGLFAQSNGSLVVQGYLETDDTAITANSVDSFLGRVNGNGTVDTTFATNGFVRPATGSVGLFFESVAQQADGKILAAGFQYTGGKVSLVIARYLAGNISVGSIQGTVFNDVNGNGIQDTGETGMSSVVVFADLKNDGQLDPGDPAALTDVYGTYGLSNLPAGSYRIEEEIPNGYGLTVPKAGYYVATVVSGQNVTGLNFGNQKIVVTPVFSNLTVSPRIPQGTASVTFSGTLADGTLIPPSGETVTISLNGDTQSTTINTAGNFSSVFNTSTLPASNMPYTVVYAYAGDATFGVAIDDITTTLLVMPLNGTLVHVYRLFSPVTKEHLYTADLNEYNTLKTYGWNQEGVAYNDYNGLDADNSVTTEPLYRLYDIPDQQHLWTTDANEYNTLKNYVGVWSAEGVAGYIFPSAVPSSNALYRMNYPATAANPDLHMWTTNLTEFTTDITSYGWTSEGIIGYVM